MSDAVQVHSHWSTLIKGFSASSMEAYTRIEAALGAWEIPDARVSRASLAAGGILSAKREYLRVQRKEYRVEICAAPFGRGFFFSTWLVEPQGCLAALAQIPLFFFLAGKHTYFHSDSASMFYSAVHHSVLGAIDEMTKAQGLTSLAAEERKPTIRSLIR